MRRLLLIAFFAVCLGNGHGSGRFQPGVIELSGNGDLSVDIRDTQNLYYFSMAPSINFYCIADGIYVGPLTLYSRYWSKDYVSASNGYGVNAGYTLPFDSGVNPYFGVTLGYRFNNTEYDGSFAIADRRSSGIYLPVYFGIKIALGESFLLNLQPTYTYSKLENASFKSFGVKMGFSGLVGRR
jgi:hypothetical protein